MYAVEQGLALPSRSPQIDGLLGALLAKLEKDKPVIAPGGDDAAHCERFALGVFARADKVDRAGRADKATATAFYAASIFFEVRKERERKG
jgi:vacuolar protein sorting-associated protein VTA1